MKNEIVSFTLQALLQHPRDDHGSPISSISHPKISWRLSEHILEIAQKDKKLRRFVVAHGENMKELLDYVRFLSMNRIALIC